MAMIENPINFVAAFGLALGAVFGMAGTFVAQPNLQALLWAIDSVGLVTAAALLALKYFRTGDDVVAGGFLVFAIAEAVILSGTAAGPAASVPSFAAGTARHSPVGERAPAHQHSETIRATRSTLGSGERASLCHHRRKNFLGRATAANRGTAAVLCLPLPCPDLHRLDFKAIALKRVASVFAAGGKSLT